MFNDVLLFVDYLLLLVCAIFAMSFGKNNEQSRAAEKRLYDSLNVHECMRNCLTLHPLLADFKSPGETTIGYPKIMVI